MRKKKLRVRAVPPLEARSLARAGSCSPAICVRAVSRCSQHCDLYVVRVLPVGRQIQGSTERDPARFGFSKPCVRCLMALEEFGVHRVIFTTGKEEPDGGIGCEVGVVHDLLAAAKEDGHSSRGDEGAIACGALRAYELASTKGRASSSGAGECRECDGEN